MVAVYLKNDEPYSVLFSQHDLGAMELWKEVRCVKDLDGNETTHPLIYVALGSHANYSKPEVIRSASLFHEGLSAALRVLDRWLDPFSVPAL